MAPISTELATLRALTFRISSTPTAQLPQHVPAIAASLTNCRTLLSTAQASGSKTASEASVAAHKYRTLLSTLLQDRSIQGRWAAIVLIKSTIEIGGWETLHKSLPWVRGLLGILTKPDPPTSKKLCIITLVRIFILTREYPTLIREITTPSLPTFVQTCLQITSSPAVPVGLLQIVLESFNQLLPRHPTIFRSYLKQLNQLLGHTMAPTPSSRLGREQISGPRYQITSPVSDAARELYTQLSYSAPKGMSGEEWQASFKKSVDSVHRVADRVLRAVVEDWKSSRNESQLTNSATVDDEVQELEDTIMGLSPWSGIFAGGERLVNLLKLITIHLECATAGPINLNVGTIFDLSMRLLSVTVPYTSTNKDLQNYIRFNNQVSKEERENLWLILPKLHVAVVEVLLALSCRINDTNACTDGIVLDQLAVVFSAEKTIPEVRTACYLAIAQILERSGTTLPKSSIDPLATLIRSCCDDILPVEKLNAPSKQTPQQDKTNGKQKQASMNADSFLNSSNEYQNPAANLAGLQEAAYALVTVLITNIPHHLSDSLRTRLDRTAILSGHKKALVSSVLNPPPSKKFGKPVSSILPLLARTNFNDQEVEALIKPRMPVIRLGKQSADDEDVELEDEEDEEEEEEPQDEEEEEEEEHEKFVGHELDSLLETANEAGRHSTNNVDVAMMEITERPAALTGPIPSFNTSRFDAEASAGNKRSQEGIAPPSPVKRPRIDQSEAVAPTQVALNTQTVSSDVGDSTSVEAVVVPATMPQSSIAPAAVEQEIVKSDDDDEDVVPLVFGQDTDEESD
ncbi:unnamed protein product [Periconia digitata]|uniref:Pre-rRNA-processing protein RIX1 n=1 Tax=Periconia digitata TaxID=1303443 RepID=A0A9W4UED6_9PLEO|nr:unnamed protein product [Periconia digitata]